MPAHRATEIRIHGVAIKLHRVGEGPPLLFLHGADGLPQWLPFFDALADGYELLVPEHPGFGASDDPPWIRNVADLAMFYLDFVEELGLERFHLIGHSLGGWLAAEIADPRPLAPQEPHAHVGRRHPRRRACRPAISSSGAREETLRNVYLRPGLAERMLAVKPTEEQMDIMLKNRFTATKFGWQPRWFNPDLEKWLHRIKLPALVVWGREDKIFPLAYADLWHGAAARCAARHGREMRPRPHVEKADEVIPRSARFPEGGRRDEAPLLPSHALSAPRFRGGGEAPLGLGRAAQQLYDPVKGAEEYERHIDFLVYAREARLRRNRRQRASPDRLRHDAGAQSHRQRAHPAHQDDQDRDPRPRAADANNPIYIAEEYAMLDNLSKGRIICGFVRGIGAEYHSSGINPYFSHERFHEAHDLIVAPGPSPARGASRARISTSATSIFGRAPISSRIRRSGSRSQGSSETVAWASASRRANIRSSSPSRRASW